MKLKINYFFMWGLILLLLSMPLSVCFFYLLMVNVSVFLEWELLNLNSCNVFFIMVFDIISCIFLAGVLIISSMVIVFSSFYMEEEVFKWRFLYLVLLFVLSMGLVIISPNLVSLLLGWDGLGLVSFLLVIYFQNFKSLSAGMITALSNRIGDVAILLAIAFFLSLGSWNFFFLMNNNDLLMLWICFCIIVAGLTKSAQMPFSAWLPAAMAAPTPVSALVHSSTLVAAGVYLIYRWGVYITCFYWLNISLFLISSLTMLMAGICACFEMDFKKVIALSTLSQLGLMMMAVTMHMYLFAFFHLLTHALFKALLFLCAGVVIHTNGGSQDIRFLGSLNLQLPLTSLCFSISNLALSGFPFLAGFYSKDLILESSILSFNFIGILCFYGGAILTVIYSIRLMYFSMASSSNQLQLAVLGYESKTANFSTIILSLLSICFGWLMSYFLLDKIFFLHLDDIWKLLGMLMVFSGVWMMNVSLMKYFKSYLFLKINFMNFNMWNLNEVLIMFNSPVLKLGVLYFKLLDSGWLELMGPVSISNSSLFLAYVNQGVLTKELKLYFIMSLFLLIFLLIITF